MGCGCDPTKRAQFFPKGHNSSPAKAKRAELVPQRAQLIHLVLKEHNWSECKKAQLVPFSKRVQLMIRKFENFAVDPGSGKNIFSQPEWTGSDQNQPDPGPDLIFGQLLVSR